MTFDSLARARCSLKIATIDLLKLHVRTEDEVNSLAIVAASCVRVMVDNTSMGDVKYRIATNSHG